MRRGVDHKLLISGYTLAIASLKYVPKARAWGLRFVGECGAAVNYAAKLICQTYKLEQLVTLTEHERLNAKNTELVVYGEELDALMEDTGFATTMPNGERSYIPRLPGGLDSEHGCRAFIRGVFLACGSVSDPAKGCHAELVIKHELLAREVMRQLMLRGIMAKLTVRKSCWVLYLKDGEMVEDFLTFMGAGEAMLAVREQRMLREIANHSNREVNCIAANIEKTARAAVSQIDDITLVLTERGADCLNEQLYEVASARMDNPEMTLAELGVLIGIGKSAVNYRLRKIAELANEIREEKGILTDI